MLKFTKYGKKSQLTGNGVNSKESGEGKGFRTFKQFAIVGPLDTTDCKNKIVTDQELETLRSIEENSSPLIPENLRQSRSPIMVMDVEERGADTKSKEINKSAGVQKPQVSRSLSLSKVPKDELIKMDTEISLECIRKSSIKRTRTSVSNFDVRYLSMKRTRVSLVSLKSALDTRLPERTKISMQVYNDGYFPRIQPLRKVFAMKDVL